MVQLRGPREAPYPAHLGSPRRDPALGAVHSSLRGLDRNHCVQAPLKIRAHLRSKLLSLTDADINGRATLMPWHVYIHALAVATCTAVTLEKATFPLILHYSTEAILVNSLGVSVVIGGFVFLAVISPVNDREDILRGSAD
ncbi:hypothetical protein LguiB_009113 [Lonicera macranthoides]